MDLSVRKIEAVEMASPNTTRTSEPRNEITKKKTLSFSVDRLLKSSNSSEDSKLEGMKQFCNKLLPKKVTIICITTLLLNEGIPRALKGKKLRLKIPSVLPSIFEFILVIQI